MAGMSLVAALLGGNFKLTYQPINAITRKPYNGGNIDTLEAAAEKLHGLNDPRWMTFLQAKTLGLKVKKGEHGTRIEYWMNADKLNAEQDEQSEQQASGKKKNRLIKKVYVVFHASQIEGIEPYNEEN